MTKFQKPLIINLGVAGEKPDGGPKKPPLPTEDKVKIWNQKLKITPYIKF